jgi:hypothetical protein
MTNLTIKEHEELGEIARSAVHLATHGEAELAVALAVYLAAILGRPVDAIALANELADIGQAEKGGN